jgi:hypothetical protein
MAREEYDLDPQTYKTAALSALEDLDETDELGDDPDAGTPDLTGS